MKQKLLLKSMLLLFALIAGSSSVWAAAVVGTIHFGSATGSTNVNAASVSGNDSKGNTWTVTTEGTTSFTPNASYAQIGSSNKPATSITFTTTLASSKTISAFSAQFGGFSNTAGTVTLKVGDTTVGSGSLNGTSDVTVSATNTTTSGTVLTVTVTGISKGVKAYYISYTYDDGTAGPSIAAPTFSPAAGAVAAGSTVTLSHADADAIRYTTDGTNPTKTTGTVYSAPITITTATTIKAIAIKGENVSSVASASYTITVAAPTFSPDGGSYFLGTELTLTSAGNTIYYTTDGSNPSNTSTEYTGPIAIATGKITYKAIAYDKYGNSSTVTSRTITGVAPATLPFAWDAKETSTTGVISTSVGTYDSKPYLKFDATGDNLILKFDGVADILSFDIKNNSFSGGTFKVQTSVDGVNYSDLAIYTTITNTQSEKFKILDEVRYIKWIYTNKSSGNVGLGNIKLFAPVTISSYGWATYTTPCAVDFTGLAVKAYAVEGRSGSSLTLSSALTAVPAKTPLLLNGPAGSYNIPIAASASAIGTNKLKAGTGAAISEEDGKTKYVLGVEGSVATFLKIVDGTPATVPVDKSYLEFDEEISAPILDFGFDGEGTTDIKAIDNGQLTIDNVYNLNGQRVAQPTKGLYIVNGKKVIIK